MSPEQWAKWKNNPQTKKFFKYISDFRDQAAREVAAFIAEGISVSHETVEQATLRCQIMKDLEELTCEDITQFYQPEKEEDNDDNGP
jgi:hypothetical protein